MSSGPPPRRDTPDDHGSHRRRHSLPPANKLATIISFWSNGSEDSLRATGERRPRSQASANPARRARRSSKASSKRGAPVSQPVLVKAYSPRPESALATTIPELDETERVELPPIDAFSFNGILKAIDPKVTRTLETITQLSSGYRSNLTHETEILVQCQRDIESQILTADRLSSQVLKATTTRSDRLKSESTFRNGVAVEELAQTAEGAYSTIENIIATLEAIDEMLPPQDRLGTVDSPHKRHFPYTHSLLAAKTAADTVTAGANRQLSPLQPSSGVGVSVPSPLSPRMTGATKQPSSQSTAPDSSSTAEASGSGTGSWLLRRRQGSATLPYLSPNGPPMSPEERRLSSPPALLLRTVHPSAPSSAAREVAVPQVTSPSPYHLRRQSAHIVTNIPTRERDSLSMQSNAGQSTRSSFSFKNLLWGGGGPWRRSSNASVASSVAGSESGETAEEKLRRIIQEQTRKRLQLDKKGAGLSSSLPM
ncbi:hypothetical protein TWF696_007214 [Orbilia brochopaga]|uniref:BLOC-1-related complex subunit 5 n=1 Tax=Orbilia brochopaga TaxID=3140254 RepID=A0AAV9US38_9PEZI